jgi:hypothetical protein
LYTRAVNGEGGNRTAAALQTTEGAVKTAVSRLRRRFGNIVREEIANTVSSRDQIDDEMRHLWSSVKRDL